MNETEKQTVTDTAETIRAGDVIMPPERELRLWMRRHVADKGLLETSLHLTVEYIAEGKPDKGGRWILFRTHQNDALAFNLFEFRFKARPGTPWAIVKRGAQ